ncbi:MAG: hypothetical protein PHS57_07265 [Alphaproteobacteria bacterium]|nr:hypothetical protein [Alphaproteobacteria bacterium]
MASEYLKPMLDIGSPRVLNCNVMTRRILAKDPQAKTFFSCKPLNNLVLIKDTDPFAKGSVIGTKLYFPFNENDIYEGGRTVFAHTKGVEQALIDNFGEGALPKDLLAADMRILRVLDRLPSLDPFLLKDVFINEHIPMNPDYFEVSKELWNEIETYILKGFEPLAKAAFPDALSSDEVARKLVETIWEGRDLETLKPLIMAFRLAPGHEHETFSAWKGIIFYGFEHERMVDSVNELSAWLQELKVPVAAGSTQERLEIKTTIETVKTHLQDEWNAAGRVLKEYQSSYDKMFKNRTGSSDFVKFLQNSSQAYETLGNCLGKVGHAIYCWDATTKRHPDRKPAWEQTLELILLLDKILEEQQKMSSSVSWS